MEYQSSSNRHLRHAKFSFMIDSLELNSCDFNYVERRQDKEVDRIKPSISNNFKKEIVHHNYDAPFTSAALLKLRLGVFFSLKRWLGQTSIFLSNDNMKNKDVLRNMVNNEFIVYSRQSLMLDTSHFSFMWSLHRAVLAQRHTGCIGTSRSIGTMS